MVAKMGESGQDIAIDRDALQNHNKLRKTKTRGAGGTGCWMSLEYGSQVDQTMG